MFHILLHHKKTHLAGWEAAVSVVNICKSHACTHSFFGKKIFQQKYEEIADILKKTEQYWIVLQMLEVVHKHGKVGKQSLAAGRNGQLLHQKLIWYLWDHDGASWSPGS